jgi:phosphonate transport system substrate-binding protein
MTGPVRVGAVLYDPKVAVIWEIIGNFFEANACPIDVVFYADYQLQVTALLNGQIDIAWNSPLAWLDAQRRSGGTCRAIAMRDTDRGRETHLITRKASGIDTLEDLRGTLIAVGARDSPQATLIPMGFLARHGLETPRDYRLARFDVLVGTHGDHVGGERDALNSVTSGESQAAAVLDLNWDAWTRDGTVNAAEFGILATTDRFDHCVFTVRQQFPAGQERQWLDVLFSMTYEDPTHREMMDLEGLKAWHPGRTSGFGPLADAVARFRFFESAT